MTLHNSVDAFLYICCLLTITALVRWTTRPRRKTTVLNGPLGNPFFGLSREVLGDHATDLTRLCEEWEIRYGSVFHIPGLMGSKQLVLCDLKAIAHYFSTDTYTYRQTPANRFLLETFFGRNLLWAEGEAHKRQRKALSSAFSNSAIRGLTPIFYDSVYKLKASWDSSFQTDSSTDTITVDVQNWMNRISLDSIGKAGFSYDFRSLEGKPSAVVAAFDSFGAGKPSLIFDAILLLAPLFPFILKFPSRNKTALRNLEARVKAIAGHILEKARVDSANTVMPDGRWDRSIIGTLGKFNFDTRFEWRRELNLPAVRSEGVDSMSSDEVTAQLYLLIVAGYETTAISLTVSSYPPPILPTSQFLPNRNIKWALIELSRAPDIQEKLREELVQLGDGDPTWDQMTSSFPYLDAVTCESLRLHPAVRTVTRQAHEDDIIPLSKPVRDANRELVDRVFIARGTTIHVPVMCINHSEALWGADAKIFRPSRWLDGTIPQSRAIEIQGHRHMLTFANGPRTCLGKDFAITEFKAVLSVLIRSFYFELPDGPSTKIEWHKAILERPKIAGQDGARVPLLVRRL